MQTVKIRVAVFALALAASSPSATAQEFRLQVKSLPTVSPDQHSASLRFQVEAASRAPLGRAQIELRPEHPLPWRDGEPVDVPTRYGSATWFLSPDRQAERLLVTTAGYGAIGDASKPGWAELRIPPGRWMMRMLPYAGYNTSGSFVFRLAEGEELAGEIVLRVGVPRPPQVPPPPPSPPSSVPRR